MDRRLSCCGIRYRRGYYISNQGQKVSHSVPILTAIQEKTISMLAFPDSNSVA